MSQFSDAGNVDEYAHYSQHLTSSNAPNSGDVFGGDGFASRSTSVSIVDQQQPVNSQPSPPPPPPAVQPPTPTSVQVEGSPAAASSSSAAFHEVQTQNPSTVITTSSPTVFQGLGAEDREFDESRCKHGRIIVGEPELRSGRLTSHHVYKVSCAAGAIEHVFRRYSDFVWLRNVLVKAFPGVFVPPLPPKQVLGNKDNTFVESRRQDLQRWLTRVVIRPFLSEHTAVEVFLQRASAAFEQDQKDIMKQVESKPVGEIVALYSDLFPEIYRLPATGEDQADSQIDVLLSFLTQSEAKMQALATATEKYVHSSEHASSDLNKVTTAFQAAFDLERGFVGNLPVALRSQPILPRVDLTEPFQAWAHATKYAANHQDELLATPFLYEAQDLTAMIDLIRNRNELHQRHAKSVARAGKWNLPANTPKNEKQEQQRHNDELQARDEGALLDLVNKLILHAQFESFWSFRMAQFRKRLNRFARTQMEATKQLYENWSQIAAATVGTD